ncbi:hypothetical protein N7462_001126 [Penicillium macrosclerotiorum]|uniref:uncharacterized protein n=1 Tax=Penicillium macrosclerotiorum TaxID=303699 RepID=UPI0025484366|nr:uncharacterized protein N7462_001126 [Penicillium macrosclerotiorum]KAJ5699121.1 hypothetical protein N7462_001126 [Penicillium macrosclerotiorum]
MHHWDLVYDSAVAPSPIVPTYRPDPPSKRKLSNMPSSVSGTADSAPSRALIPSRPQVSPPRPQARSAGMAERPGRNENLSDLVRFFQTQNAPAPVSSPIPTPASPDNTTALPIVTESKEPMEPMEPKGLSKETKPLHRRLLHFTQRQKKEPTSRSKLDEKQRQIEALQREGYLLPNSKPRSTHSSKTSISSKSSLERTFSRSKRQDVETIGQPWLESDLKKLSNGSKQRLASLDLSDFGSMVDVAVSLSSTFDDASQPTHRPPPSNIQVSPSDQKTGSEAISALPPSKSSTDSVSQSNRPTSPAIDGKVSNPRGDHARQSSSSSNLSVRIVESDVKFTEKLLDVKLAGTRTIAMSDESIKHDARPAQVADQQTQTRACSSSSSNGTAPAQPSLKLFPDVAPPRISSKGGWRISSVPQYQRLSNSPSITGTDAPVETLETVKPAGGKQKLSETHAIVSPQDAQEPCYSGAPATPAVSTKLVSVEPTTKSKASAKCQTKSRPPSLAMGTLQAFPLPAPTRPLPSIPKPGRPPPAAPDADSLSTIRPVRSALKAADLQSSQPSPITEHPHELEDRPATALGYVREAESEADHDSDMSIHIQERPKSTSPEQNTPRRRASSLRIPRMQDLPENSFGPDDSIQEGQPLADSPVLGQVTPTKPHGKRDSRKELQINSRVDRKNLPFGLPSPPPTAALPSDPPSHPLAERSHGHRNFTAPVGAGSHLLKGVEPSLVSSHRSSMVSRSNSSGSSLRHESIPESYEPDRCESPLPSSDDEGFGPVANTQRPRHHVEKHTKRVHPLHQGYETVAARPSHGRLRYPHNARSQTPQGRSSHSLEIPTSPQSTYSQSTYRSRESHSNYRSQSGANHMAHYLEDRVLNLERQNQILQAALMAALNAGGKSPFGDLNGSPIASGFPGPGHANPYHNRFTSRPDSWVSSSRSSEHDGFEIPGEHRENREHRDHRPSVRQLDNMIEDIEGGWMSDKSNLSGARIARTR